jgi:hypothetical protein
MKELIDIVDCWSIELSEALMFPGHERLRYGELWCTEPVMLWEYGSSVYEGRLEGCTPLPSIDDILMERKSQKQIMELDNNKIQSQ